jgi:hypothetical protein
MVSQKQEARLQTITDIFDRIDAQTKNPRRYVDLLDHLSTIDNSFAFELLQKQRAKLEVKPLSLDNMRYRIRLAKLLYTFDHNAALIEFEQIYKLIFDADSYTLFSYPSLLAFESMLAEIGCFVGRSSVFALSDEYSISGAEYVDKLKLWKSGFDIIDPDLYGKIVEKIFKIYHWLDHH